MHKFGSGEVAPDPQDPQGVPLTPATTHESALGPQDLDQGLAEENSRADAPAPRDEASER